jgi:hypothetical protein
MAATNGPTIVKPWPHTPEQNTSSTWMGLHGRSESFSAGHEAKPASKDAGGRFASPEGRDAISRRSAEGGSGKANPQELISIVAGGPETKHMRRSADTSTSFGPGSNTHRANCWIGPYSKWARSLDHA